MYVCLSNRPGQVHIASFVLPSVGDGCNLSSVFKVLNMYHSGVNLRLGPWFNSQLSCQSLARLLWVSCIQVQPRSEPKICVVHKSGTTFPCSHLSSPHCPTHFPTHKASFSQFSGPERRGFCQSFQLNLLPYSPQMGPLLHTKP